MLDRMIGTAALALSLVVGCGSAFAQTNSLLTTPPSFGLKVSPHTTMGDPALPAAPDYSKPTSTVQTYGGSSLSATNSSSSTVPFKKNPNMVHGGGTDD